MSLLHLGREATNGGSETWPLAEGRSRPHDDRGPRASERRARPLCRRAPPTLRAVDAATLIPHMLEAFIRSDRGYRRRRSQSERGKTRQRGGVAASGKSVATRPDSDGSA